MPTPQRPAPGAPVTADGPAVDDMSAAAEVMHADPARRCATQTPPPSHSFRRTDR
jgi:hypothetical protein